MIDVLSFLLRFKYVIIFYLAIIILLIWKRKKIQTQAKIIFLYRMKWGLRWMDKYSQKHREWIILLGYIGVGVGFIGMLIIGYFLVKNLYDLFTIPAMASGVSLVLPGINVPGLGILPFWHWLIAIFFIAIVHEFSHGIVARAHNVEVKNTGIVFFGPIIGAFVEPNEKKMVKENDIVQYSILAAGSFSNIMLGLLALFLLGFAAMPLQDAMTDAVGFSFENYYGETSPAQIAGINPGVIVTGIDDVTSSTFQEFQEELIKNGPGDTIIIHTTEKDLSLVLTESPDVPGRGFLGISNIKNEIEVKEQYSMGIMNLFYNTLETITSFLRWLYLLSLGIGLFNLLPLPIVDGGRMVQTFLHKLKGIDKGEKRYRQISLFFLLVLVFSLFFPWLSKVF
ncbi:MAG: site-2 protease family protein [archaeon]|nr:site-2 protease family protein [archaeon]